MKNGMIVTKKTTWTSKVEVDYLDELSPKKQRQLREKNMSAIGEKLRQFNEYADKDNLGRVYAGGFFHKAVAQNPDGTFTAPANLPKDEVKRRLLKTWRHHLRKKSAPRGIVQHRFVISMSQPQHDLLVKGGLNPDAFLHERVRLVMKEFREKFHAGDSIGYAYGLHHDTDNLHAHIAVCPRSEYQRYVGLSEQLKQKRAADGHKNQLAFVKKICERENNKLAKAFSSFGERQRFLEQLQQRRNAGEFFYASTALPPPLPTADGREIYGELQRERRQLQLLNRQVKGRRKLLRNSASLLACLMPRELHHVRKFASSVAMLIALAGRLRCSQRGLFHCQRRYFQLHQNYYNPRFHYAVNTRYHRRRAIQQTQQA
jgi:hypothetical protein